MESRKTEDGKYVAKDFCFLSFFLDSNLGRKVGRKKEGAKVRKKIRK